jgi:hypothetical protein
MPKQKRTPLGIFIESIGLYFSNFDKFIKYMTFPVLGQIGGLGLTLILSYFYAKHIPSIENFGILVAISIGITLPGIIIFTKAFWEYLISYGAINSMLANMLKSGKVYDFDAHTELIKRRAASFIGLWFLFGIFSLLSAIPFLWVPAGVFAVFFVLTFQVFTFEPELSPIGCARKSLLLIKGHFASTFMLMALVGGLTYIIVPQIINSICEILKISTAISATIQPIIAELPIQELNSNLSKIYIQALTVENIASFTVSMIISQILIQYTLPIRSILWGLWYKELNGSISNSAEIKSKKGKSKSKRPSEKLMEESHKKFATKKIDRNILKRAMEKEE